MASGLPVLSFPHKEQKEFIEANRLGIVFEDLSELNQKTRDKPTVERLRHHVMERRHDFTVEANIGRVLGLYEDLLQ